jgi:ABC-type thiamin/hydroxymethylpyrimidine transport system permease subunit
MQSRLITLINIFLYGLLLQFFVYNWVTFGFDFAPLWMKGVWLWKELLIGVFCGIILRKPGIKYIREKLSVPAPSLDLGAP